MVPLFHAGYRYAGLLSKHYCACGDNVGTYGIVGDYECNEACPGNETLACGGFNISSIYLGKLDSFC